MHPDRHGAPAVADFVLSSESVRPLSLFTRPINVQHIYLDLTSYGMLAFTVSVLAILWTSQYPPFSLVGPTNTY